MEKVFIHCIRFADDIVVPAESAKEMNIMLGALSKALSKFKLKINKNKTKAMVVQKKKERKREDTRLENTPLEQVEQICYLVN